MRRLGFFGCLGVALSTACVFGAVSMQAQMTDERLRALLQEADAAVLAQPPAAQTEDAGEVTVPMSLDEAVTLALERNLDIAVQRLNPQLQDIAIAGARAFYNPILTSTLSQAENNNAPTSQLQVSQGGGGVRNETFTYNGGLLQNMPWGGQFQATLNNSRQVTTSNNAFYNPSF
ncbi:MAG: hypothetical protein AB7P22_15430, partial [Vicinamibacterales bacterium]